MTTSTLAKRQLPTGIWILGFVSLLMDTSSEIIHSLLPIYLVSVLGASALMVGLIEGAAEATAPVIKVFSGALSDYLGKRKGLAVIGYGLGALTKPVFALAPGLGWILAARLTDRVGKGSGVRLETPWWPISHPLKYEGRPMACVNPWTPWGRFSAPCWRSA